MRANRDELNDIEYPSTLRVEVASTADIFDDAVATAEGFETESEELSDATESILTFDSIEQLREMLSTQRIELLESLMAAPAKCPSELADRLDRAAPSVLNDVDVLVNAGVINRHHTDTTPQLSVPYERIMIEYTVQPAPSEDSAPAA
jgi:predicted transcriptional regulator